MLLQVLQVNSPDRVWIQLAEYPEHDLEALSIAVTTSDPNTVSRGEVSQTTLALSLIFIIQDINIFPFQWRRKIFCKGGS